MEAAGKETGPITVSGEVYAGLEAVRQSGLTNMLDRPRVAALCATMGYLEASEWVRHNKSLYAIGIFRGFVVATSIPGAGDGEEGES